MRRNKKWNKSKSIKMQMKRAKTVGIFLQSNLHYTRILIRFILFLAVIFTEVHKQNLYAPEVAQSGLALVWPTHSVMSKLLGFPTAEARPQGLPWWLEETPGAIALVRTISGHPRSILVLPSLLGRASLLRRLHPPRRSTHLDPGWESLGAKHHQQALLPPLRMEGWSQAIAIGPRVEFDWSCHLVSALWCSAD